MNGRTKIYIIATLLVVLQTVPAIAEKGGKTAAESYKEKKLREQKEADIKGWALGCGAVLIEYGHERHDMLSGGIVSEKDVEELRESTRQWWDVDDRDSLLETLQSLEKGGHAKKFERIGRYVDGLGEEKFKKLLDESKNDPDKLQEITIAKKYYRQLGQKSLRGWDLSRYICLCKWGYVLGYISEEEAWQKIIPVAKLLQSKFDSWEDLGQNYIIGRQFWSYEQTQKDGWMTEDAFHRLLDEQSSPWNRYPWNMDLTLAGTTNEPNQPQPESSPLLSRIARFITSRTLVVPDKYKTITDAIDEAKAGDTVFVKAGLYKENLKFKDGINLIGEDKEKVIIQGNSKYRIIKASNCKNGLISNITVEHGPREANLPFTVGIAILTSNIDITKCRVRNVFGQGIWIAHGSESVVEDCAIESNENCGIYVSNKQTVAKIKNCLISGNSGPGLYACEGACLKAEGNVIKKNKLNGIDIRYKNTTAELRGNRCTDNNSVGITFREEAEGIAEDNFCHGNGTDGISAVADKTMVTFKGNRCVHNGKYGIRFTDGANGKAESNLCESNGMGGIKVFILRTNAEIKNNTCRLNNDEGIFFDSNSSGIAEGNICEKNGSDGISVEDTAENVILRENWCRDNSDNGIWLCNASNVLIQSNICNRNGIEGIDICKESKATIEHNSCENNRYYGISVRGKGTSGVLINNICPVNNPSGILFEDGAIGRAENNVCENNLWSGIAVRGAGTNPVLTKNRCNNNGAWGIISWSGADPNIIDDNETIGNWRSGITHRE